MENTILTSCTLYFIYTIEVFDDWMIIIEEVEESTNNPFTYWFYPKSEIEKLLNNSSSIFISVGCRQILRKM